MTLDMGSSRAKHPREAWMCLSFGPKDTPASPSACHLGMGKAGSVLSRKIRFWGETGPDYAGGMLLSFFLSLACLDLAKRKPVRREEDEGIRSLSGKCVFVWSGLP